MPRNTGRREGDPAKPPFAEAKKRGGTFGKSRNARDEKKYAIVIDAGWYTIRTPKRKETTMDDRIKIITRKDRYGYYTSTIRVNGEFYASTSARSREQAIADATHYAALIEFDEFGNW